MTELLKPKLSDMQLRAKLEEMVLNARMQQLSEQHAAELTKVLQGLAMRWFLQQVGQERGTAYVLPDRVANVGSSVVNSGDSPQNADSTHKGGADSSQSLESLPAEEAQRLAVITAPAAAGMRLAAAETRRIILDLCQRHHFTAAELGELMNRSPAGLRDRFLSQMVAEGLLRRKYPDEPNRPDQAYTTAKPVGGT